VETSCVGPNAPSAGTPSIPAPMADPCAVFAANIAAANARAQYNQYIASVIADFKKAYIAQCMSSAIEQFTMKYTDKEYHFTLYYYDQAGNLVRTVPPQGVQFVPASQLAAVVTDRTNGTQTVFTTHRLQTIYTYNSLNQLILQQTPDAGQSQFWYDALGRLVVSQNAKQAAVNQYSYTRYDILGRIIEVGQALPTSAMTYAISRDVTGTPLLNWITSSTRTEVTSTYYDDPAITFTPPNPFGLLGQENLRNRVSNVTYEDTYDGNTQTFDHGTHYSYDIHGNVKTLVQDNQNMSGNNPVFASQQYKRIDYTYDLISGKVNEVMYQQNQPDQFYHNYLYDADNRITNVFTSSDNVLWDQDAKYFYYPHGPLARMESGDNKVQGVDYAYTIQGWIKGVNSNTLVESRDMGKDGFATLPNLDARIAKDEFGYNLGYFSTDYTAIGQGGATPTQTQGTMFLSNITGSGLDAASPSLFNGNIRHMVTGIRKLMPNPTDVPQAMVYAYDQLNRIKQAQMYNNVDLTNNTWLSASQTNSQYLENHAYDGNGNIIRLNRNGNITATPSMDRMKYYYYTQTNGIYDPEVATPQNATNQLAYVTDASASANYTDDIDNQSVSNYGYDYIGQLNKDVAEEIDNIEWTVSGKIKRITRIATSSKPDLEFRYDASGNRVSKLMKPRNGSGYVPSIQWVTTYYVRDTKGNVMSTYSQKPDGTNTTAHYYLNEQDVYGSSRVGLKNSSMDMVTASLPTTDYLRNLGNKNYEFSNHLGNVLVTVSDVAVPNSLTATPTVLAFYTAQVTSASDYTPFGSPMEGRTYSSGNYRYGFNGKENDNEVKGNGNEQDYGMRIYDTRLGRFMSVDPLTRQYTELTPYQYASNRPVASRDIDGLEAEEFRETEGEGAGVQFDNNGHPFIEDDGKPEEKEDEIIPEHPMIQVLRDIFEIQPIVPVKSTQQMENNSSVASTQKRIDEAMGRMDKNVKAKETESKTEQNAKKVHGNSDKSPKEAVLYEKYDKNGKFEKHGITGKKPIEKRYTKKEIDGGYMVGKDKGPRKEIKAKERAKVETNPGPKNKEPWAGKKKPLNK
jgi:RHS repeat-associated protein